MARVLDIAPSKSKGSHLELSQFDVLAREISHAGSSRRQVTRTLAGMLLGGTLGDVAARLGLTQGAAARSKHRSQERRKTHESLRDQGKGKGKKRHKKRQDPSSPSSPPSPLPPLPPGCQNCNACQMCQDGACVADPDLNGVRCEGSGAGCGYCQQGQCVAAPERQCADGSCPAHGECCDGYWSCPGDVCVLTGECCPGMKRCGETACIPQDQPCQPTCPEGGVSCPGAPGGWWGMPAGCCRADKYHPDEWYGTNHHYCSAPSSDNPGVWCDWPRGG